MVGENKRRYFIIVVQVWYIYKITLWGSQLYSMTDGYTR